MFKKTGGFRLDWPKNGGVYDRAFCRIRTPVNGKVKMSVTSYPLVSKYLTYYDFK